MSTRLLVVAALLAAVAPSQQKPAAGAPAKPAEVEATKDVKESKGAPAPASGVRWFPELTLRVPVEEGASETVGQLPFTNPGDEAREIRDIVGSCACSHCTVIVGDRTYRSQTKPRELVQLVHEGDGERAVPVDAIPVGPGESGVVQIHVKTAGIHGEKVVTVDVHTTDPETPMARLAVTVEGKLATVIDPPALDLGMVAPGSRKEFTFRVRSPLKPNFRVLALDQAPPGVTATWTLESAEGEPAVWRVDGAFAPVEAKGEEDRVVQRKLAAIGAMMLRFRTDIPSPNFFAVTVRAKVATPVEIVPTFLTLGAIRCGTESVASVQFRPRDGSDLQARSVRIEKCSIAPELVTATAHKDGDVLVVEVHVAAEVPRGLIRGDLVVETDHPSLGEQRILFNGYAR
ncbi:MAG: hypothetical protein AB7O97_17270 [Planctomycetota bacterium]